MPILARTSLRTERKVVLDPSQAKRLIRAAEGQTRVLVLLAATLGMREGELFGLVWDASISSDGR